VLNKGISHWRKYLLKYIQAPVVNPILDVTVLRLNTQYAGYLNKLLYQPEYIINSKIAVKIRDAALSMVASRFGKRPTELATLSCWNVVHPVRVEGTYLIDSVANNPTKTTATFGRFKLYVSAKVFNILKLYVKHARNILARGELISESSYLWITTTNKVCTGKVIADSINRCLEAGTSGVRIGSRNIRICLATMAAVYTKNNVGRNEHWKNLNKGISRGMRHSEAVHHQVYVKQSESVYMSRVDSLTESIMSGVHPSDNDISKLSDSSLNTAIMTSNISTIPDSPGEGSVPQARRPDEHHTPIGNRSTYEYIDMLYDYAFTSVTNISAVDIRKRLDQNPVIAKKILQNLRLQNFQTVAKLTARANTYKNFLIRNGISI
jgi:hypothetical protein